MKLISLDLSPKKASRMKMTNNSLKVDIQPYTIYGNQDSIAITTNVTDQTDYMLHMVPSLWSAESIFKEARKYDNGFYNSLSPAVSAHYVRYHNHDTKIVGEFSNHSTVEISSKESAWVHIYGSGLTTIFSDGPTPAIPMHDPRFVLFHCSNMYWLVFSPGIIKNKMPISVYRNNVMTKMYGFEFSGTCLCNGCWCSNLMRSPIHDCIGSTKHPYNSQNAT